MARLNIEDKIWKKAGVQKLMIKVGDRHKAKGILVDLWELAQQHWFPDKKLIPEQAFREADLPDILFDPTIGLAEKRPEGIYAKGSEEQFQWLFDQQVSAKKGGHARANSAKRGKDGTFKKGKQPAVPQVSLDTIQPDPAEANTIHPSLLSSPSSFLISPNSDSLDFTPEASPPDASEKSPSEARSVGPPKTRATWIAYKTAYAEKYGEPPVWNGKVGGQLSRLVDRLGAEEAPNVAAFYVTHSDAFYARTGHAVGPLLEHAEKLRMEWKTGKKVTAVQAKQLERRDHVRQQLERIERGQA